MPTKASREDLEGGGEFLCFDCLLEGGVEWAVTMGTGTALCERHGTRDTGLMGMETRCRICEEEGKVREAWTIRTGEPICIFHAIDDSFPGDDMREHDLFAVIYEELRRMGHPDAF